METAIEQKYGLPVANPSDPNAAPPSPAVGTVFVVCRAVRGADDTANSALMYSVLDAFKTNSVVDPKETKLGDHMLTDEAPGASYTFTFALKLALAKPLKY
jgi:hypothetical protein